MRLKIKNIWKIFLSTAISTSIAATNAFAAVICNKVDNKKLQYEYMAANYAKFKTGKGYQLIDVLVRPFVNGKTVYNAYNRADNKFDFIHGEADAANMGNAMTYAHTAIFSTSLLSCVRIGATNANRFGYPIGKGNEFALIDKLIKTIDAKIHTPGTTDDDKNAYQSLLKLIHLTATHIWFLRCPEGYGECRKRWATSYQATLPPFFHKIGSEFVYNDGIVRIVSDMSRSAISSKMFGSIGHPDLRENLIEAFTIIECAWKSNMFENGENSLDTSSDTQRLYDMLNEAFYALAMYGLGEIGAANGEQLAKYYNSFLPRGEQVDAKTTTIEDIYDALATSLGNAIEAVKGCYQIGKGVSNIIEWRGEVERCPNGKIEPQWKKTFKKLVKDLEKKGKVRLSVQSITSTQSPAKRPRVGAPPALNQGQQQDQLTVPIFSKTENDAALALLMLGQKRKHSETQNPPATKRPHLSSSELEYLLIPPLHTPIGSTPPTSQPQTPPSPSPLTTAHILPLPNGIIDKYRSTIYTPHSHTEEPI